MPATKPKRHVAVFVLVCLTLLLAWPVINLRDEPARAYAQRLIQQRQWERLQQHLFNGDVLVATWSRLTWKWGWSINPPRVVVGSQKWLYLGDAHDSNVSAHRFGESREDAQLALAMGENLLAWDRWLRAHGVKAFALVISPDKHRIYAKHLPQWAQLNRPPRIQALLGGPASRLLADPTPELLRLSGDDLPHTYYRSDTHWNMWGAAISMETLHQTLTRQGLVLNWALPSPPAIDHMGRRIGGDLGRFLRIEQRLKEQEPHPVLLNRDTIRSEISELDSGKPLAPGDFGQVQYPRHTVRVVTEGATNPHKLLWLRDSFGIAQSPLMAANFKESIQLHWGRAWGDQARLLVELVREQRPEIVVMTVVERVMPATLFLTPPPAE